MAADKVGEKSTIRCIDAARYALAFAVTVLIVTVTAYAIVVVFRPEKLIFRVTGGYVSVERRQSPSLKPELTFRFTLQAINPSGRVRVYYTNIKGFFQGMNESTSQDNSFLIFELNDIAVGQQLMVQSHEQVPASIEFNIEEYVFNMFYYNNSSSIPDAMLWLNGTLTSEIYSGHNTTGVQTFYYCWPLTIAGDSSENKADDATICADTPPGSS